MRPVTIVTDTTHYLPTELRERLGIVQVSLYVSWGDEQTRESDLPGYDDFYARLRTSTDPPTTSQPSVGDFVEAYEPLLAAGQRHRLDPPLWRYLGHLRAAGAGEGADRRAARPGPDRGDRHRERPAADCACLAMAAAAGAGAGRGCRRGRRARPTRRGRS